MLKKLMLIAAFTLGLAACATVPGEDPNGAEYVGTGGLIAPEPFLSSGQRLLDNGNISVVVLGTAQFNNGCRTTNIDQLGCTIGWTPSHTICTVYIREGTPAWFQRMSVAVHEAAHCAGWSTDHPGGRTPTQAEINAYL
jgi:hypothetical protein